MKRFSKITTTQLARICGVSQGTVDRALHDRGEINSETKKRILNVAKEYDYIPASQIGNQTNSMLIGVILYNLENEFFSKLAMSIVNTAREFDYSIIFQFSGKDIKNEKEALEYFDYVGVDGIILFSIGSDSEEYKNYLHSLKKPIVLIGNKLFDFTFIGIDDIKAMSELTKSFLSKNFGGDTGGNIAYYAPVLKKELHAANAQLLRLHGFTQSIKTMGMGYKVITEKEELSGFDGIICSTDYYAIEVLKHLKYPKDIAIAGFDNISSLKFFETKILTVEYSTDRIAEECVNFLLGRKYVAKIDHKLVYNHSDF